MSVSESFARIESWLSKNAPSVFIQLNQPISSTDELDKAEAILGAKFPPSVREAYTFHDGESSESKGLFGSWRWLPLQEIIEWNNEEKQNVRKYQFIDFKPSFMIPLLESTITDNNLRYVETSGDDGQEETPVIESNYTHPTRDVKYGSKISFFEI
jgi:cell wall assembly regulator SMI1